MGREKLEQNCK